MLLAIFCAMGWAQETRSTYDRDGHLVALMVITDGVISSETRWTWEGANWVEQQMVMGDITVITRRTYTDGLLTEEKVFTGDTLNSQQTWTYEDGVLVKEVLMGGETLQTTTYQYNAAGQAVLIETVDANDNVIVRKVADYAVPKVPVGLTVSAGGAYSSDVDLLGVTGGFALSRDPASYLWDKDPLELSAAASYSYQRSAGVVTQSQLDASFGLDLNHLVGRTTFFLFTVLQRNPVANLNLDLQLAPIGAKYDLIGKGPFRMDVGIAPVWNYRAITAVDATCDGAASDTDAICETNLLRASLRHRMKLGVGGLSVSNTFWYLPSLLPEDGDIVAGLSDGAILLDTLDLSVTLADNLTLTESFSFTRDLSLIATVDCAATPDNLLCSGLKLSSATTLSLTAAF